MLTLMCFFVHRCWWTTVTVWTQHHLGTERSSEEPSGNTRGSKSPRIKKMILKNHSITVLKLFQSFTGISFCPEGKAYRISSPPPSFNFDSSRKTNSLRFLSTNRQEQKLGKKSPTLELMVCAHRRNSLSQKKQQIKTSFKSDAKSRNNFYLI